MPKPLEYQGKNLLRTQGMIIPEGDIAATPSEARKIAEKLSKPVTIKSQVGVTGRSKAGGIKFAESPELARNTTLASLRTTPTRLKGQS